MESYEYAMQLEPYWYRPYENAGQTSMDRRDPANAILMYQKVIDLDETRPVPYLVLGDIYLNRGNIEDASEMYRKLDELRDWPNIQVRWSYVHAVNNNDQEALASLQRAFEQGYKHFDHIRENKYLRDITDSEEFKRLVDKFDRE